MILGEGPSALPDPALLCVNNYRASTTQTVLFALIFAHLLRCAAAILALPAADILLRLRVGLFPFPV